MFKEKSDHICTEVHHLVFQVNLDLEIAQLNKEKVNSDPHTQAGHLLVKELAYLTPHGKA